MQWVPLKEGRIGTICIVRALAPASSSECVQSKMVENDTKSRWEGKETTQTSTTSSPGKMFPPKLPPLGQYGHPDVRNWSEIARRRTRTLRLRRPDARARSRSETREPTSRGDPTPKHRSLRGRNKNANTETGAVRGVLPP